MRAFGARELMDVFGLQKRNFKRAFDRGAPAHDALMALAKHCRAFSPDPIPRDHDQVLIMYGMQKAFFYILEQLEFEPDEIIELYKDTGRIGKGGQ